MSIPSLDATQPSSHQARGNSDLMEIKASQPPETFKEKFWRQAKPSLCLFVGFIAPLLLLVLWDTILAWSMIVRYHMNDFGKFYFSTLAFLNNQDMYGPNPASFIQVGPNFGRHFLNLNPPHFHILLLPLGFLGSGFAIAIWGVGSFMAFIAGMNRIAKELQLEPTEWQKRFTVLGCLAFSGTGALLLTGQLSFLLFLPVTLAWIHARHGKWGRSALYLGIASSIKPFMLIFIPYFLLRRQFKPVGVILATVITSFVVGLGVFGIQAHLAWMQGLASVDWAWTPMNASILGILTRTLIETPLYGVEIHSENTSFVFWILLSGTIGTITFLATTQDYSSLSIDRTFIFLMLTAFLISPLGWIYYFFLLFGPFTSLVTNWWSQPCSKPQWKPMNAYNLRNLLLLIAIPGFFIPLEATLFFQPNALAALTLGSIYFWSTLVLWLSLIVDWRIDNPKFRLSQLISSLKPDNRVKPHKEATYV